MQNPNCDGGRPTCSPGEVRFLPIGASEHDGGIILCRNCHAQEIAWRRDRNRDLSPDCRFKLPAWEELHRYEPGKGVVRAVIR